jgi:IS5 family transposase
MQPKSQLSDQGDLFRSRLDQFLDRQHELYRLADQIWEDRQNVSVF